MNEGVRTVPLTLLQCLYGQLCETNRADRGGLSMSSETASQSEQDSSTLPVDLDTMRASARRLLADDAAPIGGEELETLRLTLRGHLQLLIPVIEEMTLGLPKDDIPRACALAGAREAGMRLRLGAGEYPPVRMSVAMKLARSVMALCDHYENLDRR